MSDLPPCDCGPCSYAEPLPQPPGYTCPAIDRAISEMRKLAWRIVYPDKEAKFSANEVMAAGIAELETVRRENAEMRAAYVAMQRKLKALQATVDEMRVTETPVAPVRDGDCTRCGHAVSAHVVMRFSDPGTIIEVDDCRECAALGSGGCVPFTRYEAFIKKDT
jgi:hypothetical protein